LDNPKVKLGQFWTNWDAVQTVFYNIMEVQADEEGSSAQWDALSPNVFGEWILNSSIALNSLSNISNYRFYMAPGCEHTVLRSDRLYTTETSGLGLLVWMESTVDDDDDEESWENVYCTGADCLPPTPTTPEEGDALGLKIGSCIDSALPKI